MSKIIPILALLGLPVLALAQSTTPSTTLCAAVNHTQTSVCLNSTTDIVNQTVLYIDKELMTVLLSNNQTLPAGPTYVPVSRANRGGVPPEAHKTNQTVWIGYVPSLSNLSGRQRILVFDSIWGLWRLRVHQLRRRQHHAIELWLLAAHLARSRADPGLQPGDRTLDTLPE